MNKNIQKVNKKGGGAPHEAGLRYDIVFKQSGGRLDYGDPKSYCGIFRQQAFREMDLFEFDRGDSATGIRGIIDPLDPLNPYRPRQLDSLPPDMKQKIMNISQLS